MSYCPKCGGVVETGERCWRCDPQAAPKPTSATKPHRSGQPLVLAAWAIGAFLLVGVVCYVGFTLPWSISPTRSDEATEDFTISNAQATVEEGYGGDYRITCRGIVTNQSQQASSPELEIIVWDAARTTVLATESFWPASIRNIPPGDYVAFEWALYCSERSTTIDIRVIGTDVW